MDVGTTLGAAFAGFTIGAILFGVTLTQVYRYFMNSGNNGSAWQKATVIIILVLDTLHFSFSINMLFSYLMQLTGNASTAPSVVWSLKAMGSTQVFFVIYVQGLYLYKMWNFTGDRNPLLSTRFRQWFKAFVILLSFLAMGVGILFLQKVDVISSFTLEFEYVIYVGFGTTALVDMGIAAAMCLMLYESSGGIMKKSNMIVSTLIQYVVGTGLMTSLGALMCMVLYIAKPVSLLYLGVEYSMTRLYAISVLALYNSQAGLREKWNEPAELKGRSALYFAEPDKTSPRPHRGDGYVSQSRRHRRRTSSLPDSPTDSQRALNGGFHDAETTLVQESFNRPSPTSRQPERYWTA